MTSTAPMFFSDRTSSAALTVLFAGTEKKPTCFFISSNCFAVFVGLSIAIPPRFPLRSPEGLQADLPVRVHQRRYAQSRSENVVKRFWPAAILAPPSTTAASFPLFAYASNRQLQQLRNGAERLP